MSTEKRETIRVALGAIEDGMHLDALEALVADARRRLTDKALHRVFVDFETTYGYDNYSSTEVRLVAERDETDEEMRRRLEGQEYQRRRIEEQERAAYERLRRKFG